jgi:hypothetical protein
MRVEAIPLLLLSKNNDVLEKSTEDVPVTQQDVASMNGLAIAFKTFI